MRETEGDGYRQRTKRNVADSDATLILHIGELSDGSLATLRFAERAGKPVRVVAPRANLRLSDHWLLSAAC